MSPLQLFISHSSKDRDWVDLVVKRIESAGFSAYVAEYDIVQIGQPLNSKIQTAIKESAAVVVLLTENAASSAIVREEIGFSFGLNKLVISLVTPAIAQNPAALGMLNGREYILFDIQEPQEGLIKLTDWVNDYARRTREELHNAQVSNLQTQLKGKDDSLAQLQIQNDIASLLLVFVVSIALVVVIAKSS